jgi:hypothetical protein
MIKSSYALWHIVLQAPANHQTLHCLSIKALVCDALRLLYGRTAHCFLSTTREKQRALRVHRGYFRNALWLLCRLGLSDVFAGRQQALLQAKLLHMLLPLQQTSTPAGGQQQQQQQEDECSTDIQHDENAALDPGVLYKVLCRVQGFVSGLAQARIEQQQQVLPQLQQQLQQLATAVNKDKGDSAAAIHSSSSSSSSSSSPSSKPAAQHSGSDTAEAAEVVLQTPPQLQLNPPTAAELLGYGNLQQLLLLERARQQQWLTEQLDQLDSTAEPELQQEVQLYIYQKQAQDRVCVEQQLLHLPFRDQVRLLQQLQQRYERTSQLTALHEETLVDALQGVGDDLYLLLTGPDWLGLERLVQQPQQQLPFWAACADAEAVRQQIGRDEKHTQQHALGAKQNIVTRYLVSKGLEPPGGWGSVPGRSFKPQQEVIKAQHRWQKTQLQVLLHKHAGLTEQQAQEMADTCVALRTRLLDLDCTAAAAGGRVPLQVLATLQKAAPSAANSSSSSSSSSSVEVLPGFRPSSLGLQLLNDRDRIMQAMALYPGAAGQFGIASLLVRAALLQLPGLHPVSDQPATAAAAAAVPSKQELLERLAILKQLQQLLEGMTDTLMQQLQHLSLRQYLQNAQQEQLLQLQRLDVDVNARQQQYLQQLLQLSLKLAPAAAGMLAAALQQGCQQQRILCQELQDVMMPLYSNFDPVQAAAAVLNDAYGFLAVGQLIGYVQQQQQQQDGRDVLQTSDAFVQIALQHYSYWAVGSSSSSSDAAAAEAQCTTEAAAAAAVQQLPLRMHLLSPFDEHAAAFLLDALDSAFAQHLVSTLRSGIMAVEAECKDVEKAKDLCETLQQILSNEQQQPKQWQALYLQGRGQLERLRGQLGVIAQRLRGLGGLLQAWSIWLQQLLQHAAAMQSLTALLQKRLILDLHTMKAGDQTAQEAATAAAAGAEPGASSSSSSNEGGVSSPEGAKKLSSSTSTQQLLRRLSLLHATAAVLCLPTVQSRAAEIVRLATDVTAEAQKADTLAGSAVVPPAPANSSISSVRQQVKDLLDSIWGLCFTADYAHEKLTEPNSPGLGVLIASAASGLGLLASLGMWQLPADAKGLSEEAAAFYAKAISDSSSSSSSSSSGKAGTGEAGTDSSSSSSSANTPGLQAAAQQQAALLQAHAADMSEDDGSHLCVVLEALAGRKGLSGKLAVSNHGSSSRSSWRRRLPRGRLLQLMQQHCSSTSSPTAAAAADGAEIAAAAAADGISSSLSLTDAVWGLVLAVKPSVAAALHCSSLPAACRSYDAFERAVLGWPPTDAEPSQQQQQQDESGSSNPICSCGKPGVEYDYAVATSNCNEALGSDMAAALAASGMNAYSLDTVTRAVCGDAACVARELQQLAQQGPPVAFRANEVLSLAMTAVRRDLLRLPEEYR